MERIALALSPLRDASPRDIVSWSRDAEARGYEPVFIPESYCDSLAYAEAVALATSRLRVGTGVTNVYLRQPTLLRRRGRGGAGDLRRTARARRGCRPPRRQRAARHRHERPRRHDAGRDRHAARGVDQG